MHACVHVHSYYDYVYAELIDLSGNGRIIAQSTLYLTEARAGAEMGVYARAHQIHVLWQTNYDHKETLA